MSIYASACYIYGTDINPHQWRRDYRTHQTIWILRNCLWNKYQVSKMPLPLLSSQGCLERHGPRWSRAPSGLAVGPRWEEHQPTGSRMSRCSGNLPDQSAGCCLWYLQNTLNLIKGSPLPPSRLWRIFCLPVPPQSNNIFHWIQIRSKIAIACLRCRNQ